MTKYIPNTLTCANLACGFYASIAGINGDYRLAMFAIFAAAVFDFADGLAARMLKAYSSIGKELDSLADIVSFGVAPGMMLYAFIDTSAAPGYCLVAAFAVPVFSGLRLAKFNIDDRQMTSFLGLPVPAHAILWSSLLTALSCDYWVGYWADGSGVLPVCGISVAAVLTSLLLVSEIPMFSLKMSSLKWSANKRQYVLIVFAILLVAFFGVLGISATVILYILMSSIPRLNKF